jgi:hypothetical protein
MPGFKAPEILRSEAYFEVRRRWAFFSSLLKFLALPNNTRGNKIINSYELSEPNGLETQENI